MYFKYIYSYDKPAFMQTVQQDASCVTRKYHYTQRNVFLCDHYTQIYSLLKLCNESKYLALSLLTICRPPHLVRKFVEGSY